MSIRNRLLGLLPTILIVAGCAKAQQAGDGPDASGGPAADASCGTMCDEDKDGVFDGEDACPHTPAGAMVNHVGCADSQLTAMLEPTFPPYNLTWVPTGDLGKAGGLTWTYTNIERKDLFHIDWIVCDDPAEACGLSLDGPIDLSGEVFQYSSAFSDLSMGRLVFTNATKIKLADLTTPALNGRLTVTIVDASDVPIHFAAVGTLGVTARAGMHGAEITGTAFKVVALAEVQDPTTLVWTPYLDYYNAAPTPMPGGDATVSLGGYFYDK